MTLSTAAALDRPGSPARPPAGRRLRGKRAAVVVFSYYPADPRPRRAAEALVKEGMSVDLICLRAAGREAQRETVSGVDVLRLPLERRRGGAAGYVLQYAAFVLASFTVLATRSLSRRYDLVHVHNMPDVLVVSALVPKALGARVILDLHDPMPELMTTIFGLDEGSVWVRTLKRLERWSIGRADLALTVNLACKRLFESRSCPPEKIQVVMNSPDEEIFGSRPPEARAGGEDPIRPFVVMYHGSLVERNGLTLAVEAVARLREAGAPVELRIYGRENRFLAGVMESVRARGLAGAVRHLGPRSLEGIVAAIEESDVGVIPNQRSLFTELNTPTRIFEYLAVGKPVIAPRAAGIRDYFGEDALIYFELGDAGDLARQIESVRCDPRGTADVVRRGQEVYREHAWRQEREVMLDLVTELVERGGRRR